MLDSLISIFAPHECLGCMRQGSLLCSDCAGELPVAAERCYRCRALSVGGRTCATCRRSSGLYSVRAATNYEGLAKQLIGRMKFSGAIAARRPLARLIVPLLPSGEDILLMHVPTASSRIRQRGYDHAGLLARELARQSSLPCAAYLRRTGQQRQTGASRKQRLEQLQHVFWVTRPEMIRGRRVVLVDDVLTTGASLEAAARALKTAGAKRVSAVVCARA